MLKVALLNGLDNSGCWVNVGLIRGWIVNYLHPFVLLFDNGCRRIATRDCSPEEKNRADGRAISCGTIDFFYGSSPAGIYINARCNQKAEEERIRNRALQNHIKDHKKNNNAVRGSDNERARDETCYRTVSGWKTVYRNYYGHWGPVATMVRITKTIQVPCPND